MVVHLLYEFAGLNTLMYVLFTVFFHFLAPCTEKIRYVVKWLVFKSLLRHSLFACWLTGICLISPVLAAGIKEQQVKVSFIYNFAKFIKWPTSISVGTPFTICVVGEQPLSGNIDLLRGRLIDEHAIEVRPITGSDQGDCHILFIGDSEAQRLPAILPDIATLPVLSISDLPDFVHAGGIIGMKVIDDRVRFDINLAAAHKAGLDINSQLLKLATEVLQ